MNMETWQRYRAKGRNRFIWVNGFLYWGISTAVSFSLLMAFLQPQDPWWLRPAISLALFPLGGLLWARYVWRSSEAKYLQWKQVSKPDSD